MRRRLKNGQQIKAKDSNKQLTKPLLMIRRLYSLKISKARISKMLGMPPYKIERVLQAQKSRKNALIFHC